MIEPRHLADDTAPCPQCGARWTPDGGGLNSQTMTHTDACTYLAGIDPAHPQYGPDWIAGCYGVEVTDPCPVVVLPAWIDVRVVGRR